MKHLTPMQAIKAHCKHCSAGSPKEVRLCPVYDCTLYLFRFGKRPKEGDRIELSKHLKGVNK